MFRRFVLMALAIFLAPLAHAQQGYAYGAPYAEIRWEQESPSVLLDGEWSGLESIDAVTAVDLVAFCKTTWPDRWQKRFEEDLVEALTRFGKPPKATVDLALRDLETDAIHVRAAVPMTVENRQALARAARARRTSTSADVPRVQREHAAKLTPGLEWLARFVKLDEPKFERARALADLEQLEWILEHHFAYRDLRAVPWREAIDAVRIGLPVRVGPRSFTLAIAKLLGLFGDGHTRTVSALDALVPRQFLPFLMDDSAHGLVAFHADRSAFLDPQRPFVVALDGQPVQWWIDLSAVAFQNGAPQLVRRTALRNLRAIGWLRMEAQMGAKPEVEVVVARADGADPRTLVLPVSAHKPAYGAWPRPGARELPGGIAYVRIASMDDDPKFVAAIVAELERASSARALVIDVRDNGGGSRLLLEPLYARFLPKDSPPRIVNVAAYRLGPADAPDRPEGFLANRSLFPPTAARWNAADRSAIQAFLARFEPEWKPGSGMFSAWHVARAGDAPVAPGARFAGPVAVLVNAGCFSATDVFVSAFEELPNVTVFGTPTAGGSGRAELFTLEYSGVSVQVSTMASFRADGRLYEGRGIEPDVVLLPEPLDFVGGSDRVLETALAALRRQLATGK